MTQRFRPMVVYYGLRCGRKFGEGVRLEAERYARHSNGHILDDAHYHEMGRPHRHTLPALVKALKRAKDAGGFLVVPRFEPLAGDAVFLRLLWESGVEFAACDNEHANRATLPLLASLVIKRSQETSARAKEAWAKRSRRKSHGSLVPPDNLTQEARLRGGAKTKHNHLQAVPNGLAAQLLSLRAQGKSLRQIAAILYDQGKRSETGRPWSHTRIRRLLAHYEERRRPHTARRAEPEAKKAVTR